MKFPALTATAAGAVIGFFLGGGPIGAAVGAGIGGGIDLMRGHKHAPTDKTLLAIHNGVFPSAAKKSVAEVPKDVLETVKHAANAPATSIPPEATALHDYLVAHKTDRVLGGDTFWKSLATSGLVGAFQNALNGASTSEAHKLLGTLPVTGLFDTKTAVGLILFTHDTSIRPDPSLVKMLPSAPPSVVTQVGENVTLAPGSMGTIQSSGAAVTLHLPTGAKGWVSEALATGTSDLSPIGATGALTKTPNSGSTSLTWTDAYGTQQTTTLIVA
jgi:hypothetical protein